MLEGWSVNALVTVQSGFPWNPSDTTTFDWLGTGENGNSGLGLGTAQFWNYSGPTSAFKSGPTAIPQLTGSAALAACQTAAVAPYAGNAQLTQLALASLNNLGCYAQGGGVLTPPAYGTEGDAGRNIFRGQPFYNVDLSIAKDWKFKERFGAQFRAEIFNLFNRTDLALPVEFKTGTDPSAGGTFGCGCTTPDATGFTNSVLGSGASRSIQLGLKLTF